MNIPYQIPEEDTLPQVAQAKIVLLNRAEDSNKIIKDNQYIWIEFKMEDKQIEPHQRAVIRELLNQNVHVYVVRFVEHDYWLVNDFYQIKFRQFKDGVRYLWELLLREVFLFYQYHFLCICKSAGFKTININTGAQF